MGILTKDWDSNFTQIPNDIINDKNVSLKAKGLYLYMASKPDVWEFSLSGMISQLKESKTTILSIIEELIKCGYLEKTKVRIGNKQGINEYKLFRSSQLPSESSFITQKNKLRKINSENFTTSNTIQSNKEKVKKTTTRSRDQKSFSEFREWFMNSQYRDGFTLSDCSDWRNDTGFKINDKDLITLVSNGRILSKDESYKIWEYLYDRYLEGIFENTH